MVGDRDTMFVGDKKNQCDVNEPVIIDLCRLRLKVSKMVPIKMHIVPN